MKFRKITLGIGLGSFWNDEKAESELPDYCSSAKARADFIATLVRLVTEQQTTIEKQNEDIESLKMKIYKLEANVNKLLGDAHMKMTG